MKFRNNRQRKAIMAKLKDTGCTPKELRIIADGYINMKKDEKKLTKKKLSYFIKDENKAVKEYNKYGLHNLAKDESKHLRYLKSKTAKR